VCPKCRGNMRTYNRGGIHIEQCDGCRGIFLDFGELEHILQMESRIMAPPPQQVVHHQPAPVWGQHGSHKYHKQGLARLFFTS
jgi:Zn-finger nucleic acid-binding protein